MRPDIILFVFVRFFWPWPCTKHNRIVVLILRIGELTNRKRCWLRNSCYWSWAHYQIFLCLERHTNEASGSIQCRIDPFASFACQTDDNCDKRYSCIVHERKSLKNLCTVVDLQHKSWHLCLLLWCLPGFSHNQSPSTSRDITNGTESVIRSTLFCSG